MPGWGWCIHLKAKRLSLKVLENKDLAVELDGLHRFWGRFMLDCGILTQKSDG